MSDTPLREQEIDDKVWCIVAENYTNSIAARNGVDKILELISQERQAAKVELGEKIRAHFKTDNRNMRTKQSLGVIEMDINQLLDCLINEQPK